MHDAINKTGNFKFIDIDYQTLQILTTIYDVPLTLIVGNNRGISNLEDLKGKRINVGAPLSIEHLAFETILTVKHWSNNHFSMAAEISDSQSQDSMAFCHGTIDAMIHIGVHPDPSLTQLFRRCNAKIANMNDTDVESLITRHPSFLKFVIPSGTYPSQKTGIIRFATQTYLVTSQTLDGETAFKILDAIYKNRKRFFNGHPSLVLEKMDIKQIADTGLKLHAGALKYFSMPQ